MSEWIYLLETRLKHTSCFVHVAWIISMEEWLGHKGYSDPMVYPLTTNLLAPYGPCWWAPRINPRRRNSVGWYTVSSAVNVTRNTLVRLGTRFREHTDGKHLTLPLRNTLHPPVITTHWMTQRSWWRRISRSRERSEKHYTSTKVPLPSTETSPHTTRAPVMWPCHSIIEKVHATWTKCLVCFNFVSERYIHSYIYKVDISSVAAEGVVHGTLWLVQLTIHMHMNTVWLYRYVSQ